LERTERMSEAPCSTCVRQGVPHGQTERGGIVLAVICWLGRERPEAVLPDRALYLPSFSHLLIVNKFRSLSLLLPPPPLSVLAFKEDGGPPQRKVDQIMLHL
jgi:hypothetical protein